MNEIQLPEQRRWKFVGKIEADTWEDLWRQFHQIEFELSTRPEGEIPFHVSGGYNSSWAFIVTEKPDMTHDRYFEELDAYLESKRTPTAKERRDER